MEFYSRKLTHVFFRFFGLIFINNVRTVGTLFFDVLFTPLVIFHASTGYIVHANCKYAIQEEFNNDNYVFLLLSLRGQEVHRQH